MIVPTLVKILLTTLGYGVGGMLVGVVLRVINRKKDGPRLDQSAAVGFLVGAAWGSLIAVFQSLIAR
jgi:hypothetical protein